MPPNNHRTVDRITQILELVVTREHGATLTEIARALEAPVSSIQGLANGLVAAGYLEEEGKRYLLGPGPYILTLRANGMPARTVSHEDLVALHRETGCSVLLGVRMGQHVVYVDEVGDNPHLAYLAHTRIRRPMLETVAGWCLLAAMPQDQLHEFLQAHPDQALVDRYLSELPQIRASGVAINPYSKFSKGTVLGSVVRDQSGRVVAAVVMGDAPGRLEGRIDEMAQVLRASVKRWTTGRRVATGGRHDHGGVTRVASGDGCE